MVSGKTMQARGPEIRPARNEDMASIRGLIRLFPGHLVQRNLPRAPSFFVAHVGGRLVGCCALQVYSKRLAEVRSLAVHPDFQDRGLASDLVERCTQRARERGVRELFRYQPNFVLRPAGLRHVPPRKDRHVFGIDAARLRRLPKPYLAALTQAEMVFQAGSSFVANWRPPEWNSCPRLREPAAAAARGWRRDCRVSRSAAPFRSSCGIAPRSRYWRPYPEAAG